MEEIQHHCYLPQEWSSNKCHSKSCVIVHEIAKDPKVTSKQLKAFFTLANVNVHESTFGRTLNNHVQATVARRNTLLSKKNIAAHLQFTKDHVDNPLLEKCFVDGWD